MQFHMHACLTSAKERKREQVQSRRRERGYGRQPPSRGFANFFFFLSLPGELFALQKHAGCHAEGVPQPKAREVRVANHFQVYGQSVNYFMLLFQASFLQNIDRMHVITSTLSTGMEQKMQNL